MLFRSSVLRTTMVSHFCGGETLDEGVQTARDLEKRGIAALLHYAVEAAGKKIEFERNMSNTIAIMKNYRTSSLSHPYPFVALKLTGLVRKSILEKKQANKGLSQVEEKEYQHFQEMFANICKAAYENKACLLVDAEETFIQEEIDRQVLSMMLQYNKTRAVVYTTVQMYRKRSLEILEKLSYEAVRADFFLGIKMVRGAYLEQENKLAQDNGIESPLWASKQATDLAYTTALKLYLPQKHVYIFAGTHNEESAQQICQFLDQNKSCLKDGRIMLGQLLGMSNHITLQLAQHGYPVCKYIPFAPIKKLVPFLIRRAQENTSVVGELGRELLLLKQELQRRKAKI